MLGVKLRVYQAWMIHNILNNKRIAACLPRQAGKSISIGVLSFWATFYNKFPATVQKITSFFIMSRDESTAMELIQKIRGLVLMGDQQVFKTKGIEHYFSKNYGVPDNAHQISWKHNQSFIKSVPPTDTVVGKSASIFFIDEAAKLKVMSPYTDKRLYYEVVEPTTSDTNGIIVLCSTPNGMNFFYQILDPDDKIVNNEFHRIWFDYTINDEPEYQKFVEEKKIIMQGRGEIRLWQQEYGALFTVTQASFFDYEDVMKNIDDTLALQYESQEPCSLGIDYGMSESRTVLTITSILDGKITLLNQIRFESNFNENLLLDENYENSIPSVLKRYNIVKVVADSCPGGSFINNWMINKGLNVELYNFRSNQSQTEDMTRNKGYYRFRVAFKAGKIRYPKLPTLIEEMKCLEETQQVINVVIKSPRGMLCDTVDSFLMSTIPFLEDLGSFGSFMVKEKDKVVVNDNNRFVDEEWQMLQGATNNLDIIDRTGG